MHGHPEYWNRHLNCPVGGCKQRSAEQRAASHGGDRPRHRVSSWYLRATHRQHPLRRFRPETGRYQLHHVKSVSCSNGVRSALLATPETLRDVYVHSSTGAEVPLAAFTKFRPTTTSLSVNHAGQFPAVTISFNLATGAALGDAVQAIETATSKMGMPESIHGTFLGTAQAFQASLANEPILILAALISVYIVLGVLYESYIHPVTILSTLPSAGVGALVALLICRNRSQPDCSNRNYPSDRPGKKERHHDSRFRPGS